MTATGVPPFPSFLIFVKLAIMVLSVIILAISAYAATIFSGTGGFVIFVVSSHSPPIFLPLSCITLDRDVRSRRLCNEGGIKGRKWQYDELLKLVTNSPS